MKKKHYVLLAASLLFAIFAMAQVTSTKKFEPYYGEKAIKRTISSLKTSAAANRLSSEQQPESMMPRPLKARLDEFDNFKSSVKLQEGEKKNHEVEENISDAESAISDQALPAKNSKLEVWSNFLASTFSETPSTTPPDPNGAVGSSQVVVTTNFSIKVFEKQGVTDAPLRTRKGISDEPAPNKLFITLNHFFAPLLRLRSVVSDPHVRYDRLSKRWFIVAVEVDTNFQNNYILLAVSAGERISDSSSFSFVRFPSAIFNYNRSAPKAPFLDYPTLGVDKNAVLIGGNALFASSSGSTDSINSVGYAIDKQALLRNGALYVYALKIGSVTRNGASGLFTPQGVYNDDPMATKSFFAGIARSKDGLVLEALTFNITRIPFALTALSEVKLPVEPFQFPRDITAPGSPMAIYPLDSRLLAAAIYKNKRTGKNSLWTAHAIGVNDSGYYVPGNLFVEKARTASRWYEIDSIYTRPHLNQLGTLFNPKPSGRRAVMYFNPSIATNGQGRSVLSGTTAAFNQYLNVFVTGRNNEDASGVLDSIQKVTTSKAIYAFVYGNYIDRWGDFSQTVVDPMDDQTIWTFQEYANEDDGYGTRAVQIKAPPPATPLPLGTFSNKADTVVTIQGISVDHSGFFDPGGDAGGPGYNRLSVKSTGNVIVSDINFISPTQIGVTLKIKNKAPGKYTFVITNPDGQIVTTTYTVSGSKSASSSLSKGIEAIAEKYVKSSFIFPNPATNDFKLILNASKNIMGKVVLLDINGKQLFAKTYNLNKGTNETVLSLAAYNRGSYVVVIYNANNSLIASHIVVKQ